MPDGRYGKLPLYASVISRLNGRGTDDYRLGNALQLNLGANYPIHSKLALITQFNLLLKDRDDRGATREEIEKTGGETLYFSPGLEFRPNKDWTAYALIQLPLYQRVNSIQVVSSYNVVFGVTRRFRMWGERVSTDTGC